jgi:hypothetical protein
MAAGESKSLDILGIKPVADAISNITKASLDGASAVLSRICLPAAEEMGLLFKDKVSGWRTANHIATMKKLEAKLAAAKVADGSHAHPRIVSTIVEQSSWIEDDMVQDMWAGLLSSSCTESGDDDSNLIFTNILGGLTRLQARVIKYACEHAVKECTPKGLVVASTLVITWDELFVIAGESDIHRLDRELDHLRSLDIVNAGMNPYEREADITPSALGLHMYVRCQGSRKSPVEFFGLDMPAADDMPN